MTINRFEDLEMAGGKDYIKNCFSIDEQKTLQKRLKLKNQINGSFGATMDNIAEGFERNGKGEFIQFLSIAKGSCGEIRSQSYRAFDYKCITQEELDDLVIR